MLYLKATLAILVGINHCVISNGQIPAEVSVECLDENDIYYPSYQFPADKDWLSTYPKDGGFENRYVEKAIISDNKTATYQPPSLLPILESDYVVCDKNVQYEFNPNVVNHLQCYNATQSYGFLPNSNKFALQTNPLESKGIVNPLKFNKDRPFLRFWLAADCGGEPDCIIRVSLASANLEIPINNTECPSSGKWKRYTVFLGDPISDILGPKTISEFVSSALEGEIDYSNIDRSKIYFALQGFGFVIFLSAPPGAAFDNVEFIGGNWPNTSNVSSREASIRELDFGDSDASFNDHLSNNANDLSIFILFIFFTLASIILIIRDIKKVDKPKDLDSVFLMVWFLVSISLSFYGITDLLNFTDVSDQFEEETFKVGQDLINSFDKNLNFEIVEQAQGVEPYGFVLQDLSGFPLDAQIKLLRLFNAKAESEWSDAENLAVQQYCTAPGINSQYICLEADNCTENNNSDIDESWKPEGCYTSCSLYSKTFSKPCEATADCPFPGDNVFDAYCYVNSTNCSLFDTTDAISYCSSFETFNEFISEKFDFLNDFLQILGERSITGSLVLSQLHITDLLVYSLVAGVVFSSLEAVLYILLFCNRKSKPVLLRATAFEVFNIVVLLVSICLTAAILYYILNEPVRVNIENSELFLAFGTREANTDVATTDVQDTFFIPVQVNPELLRFEDTTFRPVVDVPFNEISKCFQDENSLDRSVQLMSSMLSNDYKTNEICDFDSMRYYNTNGNFCYSIPCTDGVFPLATEEAVKKRIDFLYTNVVFGILIIDICITIVDVLVCILSVRKLRKLFSELGLESDHQTSSKLSAKSTF